MNDILESIIAQSNLDAEIEDFLEHFGVKGQRWGVLNRQNRALNKESRRKDWEKHTKTVDRSRGRVASGDIKREWKASKVQFKKDRERLGSREARKIMNKKRIKLNSEYYKSREARTRSGKTAAGVALVALGALQVLRVVNASR